MNQSTSPRFPDWSRGWPIALTISIVLASLALRPLFVGGEWELPSGIDTPSYQWSQWWIQEGRSLPGQSLFWTTLHNYPAGMPTTVLPLNLTLVGLTTPVYAWLGPASAHRLTIWLCWTLTGLAGFLLARRMGASLMGGIVALIILEWSPFMAAHTSGGQTELLGLHWFLLFLLALIDWWEKPTVRGAALLSISVTLLVCSNLYLTYFAVLAGTAWVLGGLVVNRARVRQSSNIQLLGAAALTLLLTSPFIISSLRTSVNSKTPSGLIIFSSDLAGFWVPGQSSAWASVTEPIWRQFPSNLSESGIYLGIGAVALALTGCWKAPQPKVYWLVVGIAATVLSLGPYLHVLGVWEIQLEQLGLLRPLGELVRSVAVSLNPNWSIAPNSVALPLPYLILKALPLVDFVRSPSRFLVISYTSLAVLAALGTTYLETRLQARKNWLWLVPVLMCLELTPRISTRSFERPALLAGELASIDSGPILDLSGSRRRGYYQTMHHRPLIVGFGQSRYPANRKAVSELGLDGWFRKTAVRNMPELVAAARRAGVRDILVPREKTGLLSALLDSGATPKEVTQMFTWVRLPN